MPSILPCNKKWLLGLIAPSIGALAFMLSSISNFWCESVKYVADVDGAATSGNTLLQTMIDFKPQDIQLGPWYRQDSELVSITTPDDSIKFRVKEVCRPYPPDDGTDVDIDSAWRTARFLSVITLLLGAALVILILISNCTYYLSAAGWRTVAIQFMVAMTISQGLTIMILQSDAFCQQNPLLSETPPDSMGGVVVTPELWADFVAAIYGANGGSCQWSSGLTCNVVALIFWFATGVVMLMVGVPEPIPVTPPETQQVTYERTVNADGTVTVSQTNVVKGTSVSTPVQPEESLTPATVA